MSRTYPFTCEHCGHRGQYSDARIGVTRATRYEPSYEFEGCRHCAPNSDDIQRARDHANERAEAEARESW